MIANTKWSSQPCTSYSKLQSNVGHYSEIGHPQKNDLDLTPLQI